MYLYWKSLERSVAYVDVVVLLMIAAAYMIIIQCFDKKILIFSFFIFVGKCLTNFFKCTNQKKILNKNKKQRANKLEIKLNQQFVHIINIIEATSGWK